MALVRDANGNLVDDGRPATGLAAAAYDPNPAVRNAQAGADARQQATATGGRAAAMQAQANQPVYGPRNPPPGAAPRPTGLGPAEKVATGVLGLPVAFAADAANQLGARAANVARGVVGAEPAPLPGMVRTNALLNQVGEGAAGVGQQQEALNTSIRGSLGLQAAAQQAPAVSPTAAAATPAQPAMDPQIAAAFAERDRRRANNAVLEQDRANMRAANFAPVVGPQPETTPPAQTLAATNQRIQAALDANRAPAQIPGERGNYNLANTSNVDAQGSITTRLRQPDNIIEGGYGGFGGGRAAQFLASRRPAVTGGMSTASEDVNLRRQLTSDNPFERRAAREQLAARQALQLDAGATQRTGMQLEGEQLRASLAGEAAVQAANARAMGLERAAQTAGEYGLQEAETKAQGAMAAAETTAGSGSNLLSRVRAEQEARRLAVAQAAFESGDTATGERALGIAQPATPRLTLDFAGNVVAADGRPVTQAEAEAFKRAQGYYAVPPQ